MISFCETMQQNQSSLFVHSCVESSSTQLDPKLFPHTTPTVSLALPCTHIHIHPLAHKYNKAETGAGGAGMTVMLHVQFGTNLWQESCKEEIEARLHSKEIQSDAFVWNSICQRHAHTRDLKLAVFVSFTKALQTELPSSDFHWKLQRQSEFPGWCNWDRLKPCETFIQTAVLD